MIDNEQELAKLTKHELLKIATDLDVKYRTRMGKPQLVESIIEFMHLKKKVIDPSTEKILSEQAKLYKKDKKEDSTKETMEASKFQTVHNDQEAQTVMAEQPKMEVRQQSAQASAYVPVMDDYNYLPYGYGDNCITLMIVDPTHIHSYWEVTDDRRNKLLSSIHGHDGRYETVVRLYDVTDIKFDGQNAWNTMEFNVGYSSNWYFLVEANRSYCAEIGMKLSNNKFVVIARSNVINTPRDTVSDFYDEEWMMIDFNKNKDLYNELYRLSGGHLMKQYQLNSAFITEKSKEELKINVPMQSLSSESLSSQFMQYKVGAENEYWLWVDTELIVYGQTKPDASSLTINGEKVKLDKEGRFRLHMALPNGVFPFKVKGISKDGSMSKEITPVVTRTLESK
ncbi:MAG: DUF4912 domain-containing protein [Candidatus Margulisbacteria bacterium]|nr:DUF4912 domain-containing protein [Candidatus Margulisiibacteriota bacterium]